MSCLSLLCSVGAARLVHPRFDRLVQSEGGVFSECVRRTVVLSGQSTPQQEAPLSSQAGQDHQPEAQHGTGWQYFNKNITTNLELCL